MEQSIIQTYKVYPFLDAELPQPIFSSINFIRLWAKSPYYGTEDILDSLNYLVFWANQNEYPGLEKFLVNLRNLYIPMVGLLKSDKKRSEAEMIVWLFDNVGWPNTTWYYAEKMEVEVQWK